jgi:hypothetical protein
MAVLSLNRAAFIIDKTRQVRFSFILEDDRISHSIDTICAVVSFTIIIILVIKRSHILFFFISFKHFNNDNKHIYILV